MASRIHVVTGPPCSGKSTHIRDHARPGDVVIDLDLLAHALGYPDEHIDWDGPSYPARAAAMTGRASLIKHALGGKFAGDVWITDTAVSGVSAVRYDRAGVDLVNLDPGRDECHRRADADDRPAATHQQIDHWYGALGTTSQEW